jgi:hypothetical protein
MHALSRSGARALFLIVFFTLSQSPVAHSQNSAGGEDTAVTSARSLIQQARFSEAVELLEARTSEAPEDGMAWLLLGLALRGAGEPDGAMSALERAAEFEHARPSALFHQGCLWARAGEPEACVEALRGAREGGFTQRSAFLSDPDLVALQALPAFIALLPPILRGSDAFVEGARVLHELDGEAAGDQFGWVARVIGDVDADGVQDFATSAPSSNQGGQGAGRVYLYSGKSGALLWTRDGAAGDRLGSGIGPAGDVDGDGVPDAIFGAPGGGKALVCAGRSGETILDLAEGSPADSYGLKVCGAGDLDGDGHGDLLIGATRFDGAQVDCGRVYVQSGKDGTVLFTLDGESAGENFGSAVDAQRQGASRLIAVGAMGAPGGGRGYVYRTEKGHAKLAFTIEPEASSRTLGMFFVSIPGDFDGDGQADVYISDFGDTSKGGSTGRVAVHSGATGERLLELVGRGPGEGFGTSASGAGDVDGDGHADLIVGAWQHASAAVSGGQCTLFSGADGRELWTLTCREAQDTFGFDAVGMGDVDGDGEVDFLLTSAWSQVLGPQTGRVFVIAGPGGYAQ